MPQPTAFDRQTSFALFSAENPGVPHSGADMDAEFNAVKVAVDETQANLQLIQDDDGVVKRGSIGRAQLDASINLGFAAPAPWEALASYEAGLSTVFYSLKFYLCAETHVAGGSFDAAKWTEIADFTASAMIEDGSIGTAKLANVAVTAAKIGTGAVTSTKLATAAVTTDKIPDEAITLAKLSAAVQALLQGVPITGDVKFTIKTSADPGWVMCNDGTIGDASSVASTRANADCESLFLLLWTNIADTYAPVTGGRGASAAEDWAAHKKIALTKTLGRALAVAGAGSGLTSRALGLTIGTETHQLTTAELAVHSHANTLDNVTHAHDVDIPGGTNLSGSKTDRFAYSSVNPDTTTLANAAKDEAPGLTLTNVNAGSGSAHNNVQPTTFLNAMIKL